MSALAWGPWLAVAGICLTTGCHGQRVNLPSGANQVTAPSALHDEPTLPDAQAKLPPGSAGGKVANATAVVGAMKSRFRACYQQALAHDPTLVGKVRLRIRVVANGTVDGVSARADGIPDFIVKCVRRRAAMARFEPPTEERAVVTVPITYTTLMWEGRLPSSFHERVVPASATPVVVEGDQVRVGVARPVLVPERSGVERYARVIRPLRGSSLLTTPRPIVLLATPERPAADIADLLEMFRRFGIRHGHLGTGYTLKLNAHGVELVDRTSASSLLFVINAKGLQFWVGEEPRGTGCAAGVPGTTVPLTLHGFHGEARRLCELTLAEFDKDLPVAVLLKAPLSYQELIDALDAIAPMAGERSLQWLPTDVRQRM